MIVQISSDNSIEISFAIIYEHKNKIKKKELMLANP